MKDLIDETRDTVAAPRRAAAPPPAAAALAARQAGAAPDTAAFLANFVKLGEIAAPKALPATPFFAPEAEPEVVAEVIAGLRPVFLRDGGDIALVAVTGRTVQVRLSGTCAGCLMSARTLATVQQRLIDALGRPVRVVPEIRH